MVFKPADKGEVRPRCIMCLVGVCICMYIYMLYIYADFRLVVVCVAMKVTIYAG